MLRFRTSVALLVVLVGWPISTVLSPAIALSCIAKDDRMIAICEGGICRSSIVVEWETANGSLCQLHPVVVNSVTSDPTVFATLHTLALSQRGDGIFGITVRTGCIRRELRELCRAPRDVQILAEETSPAALAAIEDNWRRRQAEGIEADRSYDFRFYSKLTMGTVFLVALPWLLSAVWAKFNCFRILVCLSASAFLCGMKLAFGIWMPPLVLSQILILLWLTGVLKSKKLWSLVTQTLVHLLAVLLQLSFVYLLHSLYGTRISDVYYPGLLDPFKNLAMAASLAAAGASTAFVMVTLVKAAKFRQNMNQQVQSL